MNVLEKYQSVIILFAIIFGLIVGQITIIGNNASYFITPFLFLMLFGIFLDISFNDFRKSFSNLKFTKITLFMNFIWTPLFAYFLGAIFLHQHVDIWIGFIMLMVTPCTDWYLIFTDIVKGNLPLSASIIPLNLILQLILLPVYLLAFFGIFGSFDIGILIENILLMVVLPFFLARLFRYILNRVNHINIGNVDNIDNIDNSNSNSNINFNKNYNESSSNFDLKLLGDKIFHFFSSTQIIFLAVAIFCMFASQGNLLLNNLWVLIFLLIPIVLFFIINFIFGRFISNSFNLSYEDSASLSLTTLARNSPIALAIAVTAFSNQSLVALALVIGPLIELPVLAIVSQILLLIMKKQYNILLN